MRTAILSHSTWLDCNQWHQRIFICFISERKLAFTFAICYRRSVCLSSICNVGAPYSAGSNFRQFFFALGTLAIHWHPRKILRRSSQGNPSVGGFTRKRGSQIYRFFTIWNAVSPKRCKIGSKLVLITNRKSYMSFRLLPKSVTLNDREQWNDPYFVVFFYRIW